MIPRFRAWHKTWEEIGKVKRIRFDDDGNVTKVLFVGKKFGVNENIEEIELMQSTGLKDKNGKEIFEGDIVKRYRSPFFKAECEYQIETVVKREACLVLGKKFGKNFATISFGLPFTKNDLLEVIGNIYENPELLEVKE